MIRKVLLVDDEPAVREALGQTLELAGLRPITAGSYIEAKDHITDRFAGVVVSDIRMPGKDGYALLEYAHKVDPELPVILLTGEGDIPMAVRGMASGAFDFLEKPCPTRALLDVVERAMKTRNLVLENRRLKLQLEAGDAASRLLRGQSAQAEAMRQQARIFARSQTDVLITGEPGTGTSKIAEVVHLLSADSHKPFLKFAAASQTPESLSDAFERAEGGSIFLDEIAAMGAAAQFALLGLIERPGGTRFIVGTARDLGAEVEAGRFNADLFYRLEAAQIRIPPLRERPEDIPVLFRHYVSLACEQAALPEPDVSPEVVARLLAQDWPGNSRALMNAAMRFAMGLADVDAAEEEAMGLAEQLARVEHSLLIDALRRAEGNATEAARILKLPRKTFYDKLARHGIRPELYRDHA
ncbi:sigma-54-dependent transcriptional regulator [Actibacterium sp. XHP0104]|uniref:sigma-54-dependent transcriptional regulator n=1 Tax=Actibacterium sp. XHP0104 TaxID=2984335 RepID=UPI0021E76EEA|nr:sigma-54 dependent transcriptional regulator [Actibacterium sp. XHP0104]MCV2880759.1 sigma-54 dependent transcriptional regulator [Actibacterium sp. XHP0104]